MAAVYWKACLKPLEHLLIYTFIYHLFNKLNDIYHFFDSTVTCKRNTRGILGPRSGLRSRLWLNNHRPYKNRRLLFNFLPCPIRILGSFSLNREAGHSRGRVSCTHFVVAFHEEGAECPTETISGSGCVHHLLGFRYRHLDGVRMAGGYYSSWKMDLIGGFRWWSASAPMAYLGRP